MLVQMLVFFSRQIKYHLGSKLLSINALEPHPENYLILNANLGEVSGAMLHNYSLANADDIVDLKLDSLNIGDYSFWEAAVKKINLEDTKRCQCAALLEPWNSCARIYMVH